MEPLVGTNSYWDGCTLDNKTKTVTAEELKQMTTTLGSAYRSDTKGINKGFPIFTWQ